MSTPATDMEKAEAFSPVQKPPPGFFAKYFLSHPTGFWFFFWGELAERSSYYGMRAILALYMADQLGFAEHTADMAMHAFIAACYLLTLVGGWVAGGLWGGGSCAGGGGLWCSSGGGAGSSSRIVT